MKRTIYAVELTLWKIDVEPAGCCEGERIVKKESLLAHYDGSRTRTEAEAAYELADASLKQKATGR